MSFNRVLMLNGASPRDFASAGFAVARYNFNLNGNSGNGAEGAISFHTFEKPDVRPMAVLIVSDSLESDTDDETTFIKFRIPTVGDISEAMSIADINDNEGVQFDADFSKKSTAENNTVEMVISGGDVSGNVQVVLFSMLP